jgi:hypothetical protein
VFDLGCLCSILCYVFLSLPNKWSQSLELKEKRAKEKRIWSLDRRAGEPIRAKPSEEHRPKTSFITLSEVVPVVTCDGRKHTFEIIKIWPMSQTLHTAQ